MNSMHFGEIGRIDMEKSILADLISEIENLAIITPRNVSIPFSLHCKVIPPGPYDKSKLERVLTISVPDELDQLWNITSGLRLFEDVTYGQWGLVLWSPDKVIDEQKQGKKGREHDFHPGDLVIGEFLGDSDLLLIRCDHEREDFGFVMIALPLDPREEWYVAANSISGFLSKFAKSRGEKYWEE